MDAFDTFIELAEPTEKLAELQKWFVSNEMKRKLKKAGFTYDTYKYLINVSRKLESVHQALCNVEDIVQSRQISLKQLLKEARAFDRSVEKLKSAIDATIPGGNKIVVSFKTTAAMQKKAQIMFNSAIKMLSYLKHDCIWETEPDAAAHGVITLAEHFRLAVALYEGDFEKIRRYSDMDTSSRDMIPVSVWNWIEKTV